MGVYSRLAALINLDAHLRLVNRGNISGHADTKPRRVQCNWARANYNRTGWSEVHARSPWEWTRPAT